MITFQVDDMTCGHCVGAITRAVKASDPEAEVRADLGTHRVEIEPRSATPGQLLGAIEEAGFTPVALPAAA